MRAVVQRVSEASVTIEGKIHSQIADGLLILLGIEEVDDTEDIAWLCRKIANMRIFGDEQNAMNLSLKDIDGEAIIVSQFTLHASTKKEIVQALSKPPGPRWHNRSTKHSSVVLKTN